jgi:hypothetical protein
MTLTVALILAFESFLPVKGLAMAVPVMSDLDLLRVEWYYNWVECDDPRCVSMVYSMQLPRICQKWLLVGNEPNAITPYGHPLTPREAAKRTIAIEKKCPQTKLVAANVSVDNWSAVGGYNGYGYQWLAEFLREYEIQSGKEYSQIIGVHCYTQHDARYCQWQLEIIREVYAGEMWVTEAGIVSGDAWQMRKLLADLSDGRWGRYAIYTNRQPHTGQGWELFNGVELVNGDGTLTPMGAMVARWLIVEKVE